MLLANKMFRSMLSFQYLFNTIFVLLPGHHDLWLGQKGNFSIIPDGENVFKVIIKDIEVILGTKFPRMDQGKIVEDRPLDLLK